MSDATTQTDLDGIAIIGMAGRFPGARNIHQFWENLCGGVESVTFLEDHEVESPLGLSSSTIKHVNAAAILDNIEQFDAAFFGFNPREAEIMDPQHRLFLEAAWEALENAGYDPQRYTGAIGVFASTQMSSYLIANLLPNRPLVESMGALALRIANDRDFLPTRVSYKLNLRGTSVTVATACSSSLVATHLACQSLLDYQNDMVLVGGVTINVPQKSGYAYQEGGLFSPDGHCRAFDADAQGTFSGNGLGIVVLKRLEDALADGDQIYAVIRGSATNNDGSSKVGYTAPSVDGQAGVILAAQIVADVDPETISYIETHGAGTPLGDPIEIAALTQAFRANTDATGFCAIGSVKTNVGHLDSAAGITGLIKTTLALKHRQIPPSLNCPNPNPAIDFPSTPFYVNTELRPWQANGTPRRAGVSSFGVGGTNAHVVLEEAPPIRPSDPARPWQLLLLSAKTATALDSATDQLVAYLREHPAANLADIAYTLQVGRQAFDYRQMLVCRDATDAIAALEARDATRIVRQVSQTNPAPIAFMFAGLGDHYADMGLELYQTEQVFRETIDQCAALLKPELGLDLRDVLYPRGTSAQPNLPDMPAQSFDISRLLNREPAQTEPKDLPLNRTDLAQPILFVLEYALAQQWVAWGVQPQALIGHSLGEYVAATIAGVFALPDALRVVAARARLIQSLPGGAMLTVMLAEQDLQPYLSHDVALAAVNSPFVCVVAGSHAAIDALEQRLTSESIGCRRLATSHAFHSQLMEPILERFVAFMRGVRLQAPEIPFVSNVTGTWITAAQAADPRYWARHLRQTVRFADGARLLWSEPGRILIEVGPGQSLSSMARQQPKQRKTDQRLALPTLRAATDPTPDRAIILSTFGRLWLAGVAVAWTALYRDERRLRVALPTYPFERQRYWLDPPIADQPWASAPAQPTQANTLETAAIASVHARPELSSDYVGPRNDTERTIVAMWEELLGMSPIGMYDNFFELGGHSLLATRLIGRLHEQLHIELPLQALFIAPTVAQLAEQIAAATAPALDRQPIPIAPRDQPLPLSFAQQRLWLLNQIDPHDVSYNMPFAVRVSGPLDVVVFARCIQTIVDRHETLRTTFTQRVPAGNPDQDEQPSQEIAPALAIPLLEHDLSDLAAPNQQAALQPIIVEAARQPFDLRAGPLIRIGLVRLRRDEHVVYLVMHHIISDGWSMGVFVRELLALYEMFRADQQHDQASQLPPLPVQYADYALWQRSLLRDERLAELLNYWTQRFDPLPPVLELPTDRPRPPIQTHAGRQYPIVLSAALTSDLKQFSQREGVTLYMTLLAAFMVLLHRWSGQSDLVVGSPIAGRTRRELEALIGFFVNTLALRADLSGNPAFTELLGRVRETTLGAYAHQELPFERLVEELRLARDLSHTPLVQVMFSLQNTPFTVLESKDLTMTAVEFDQEVAQFDLVLALTERDDRLMGAFEYNTDLFDAATIARMAGQFQTVLAGLLERPNSRISDLPILSAAERQQILIDWNRTEAEYPRDAAAHQLIEQQAERTPDATAIVFEDQALTYAQLNVRANQLAHYLRGHCEGPDVPVALCVERSVDLIVGMLAILKAGGCYVPLDPAYPAERLAYMLSHSRAPIILTQAALVAKLPDHGAQVFCLDADWETLASSPTTNPPRTVLPDHLAYIIFTSGSTGRPKGVQVTHAGLLNLIHWHLQTHVITAADRATHVAGLSFDAAVLEIWPYLAAGASLHLVDDATRVAPEKLRDWLRDHQITRAFVPTPLAEALLDLPLQDLPVLKTLFAGGEQLRRYPNPGLGFALVNLYGPTETTVVASFALVQHEPAPAALPPIGCPIANTRIYILDRHFNPAPLGVKGALYIGGAGVARGYLDRPDLTAENFVPDPFSDQPGARLYRTGDLARYRSDGNLEFLGRIDHQVKIRGFRIELGEIEAVLREHQTIRDAVVLLRDERLVAYIIGEQENKGTKEPSPTVDGSPFLVLGSADLRAFLGSRLPDYMIPAAFVILDQLPLTPNGKIDRKALPAPDLGRTSQQAAFVAPRTPTEELLAGIWTQLLDIQPIDVHDSFFELGGHSLLATRVVSRLRETFQIELPLRALFEAPTLAMLAEQIDLARRESAAVDALPQVPPLTPQPRPESLPLSFAQQRLWLLDQINSHSAGYNISVAVRLRGPLDEAALEASFTAVVARHEALRTRFVKTYDGQARQVIDEPGPQPLTRIDLRYLSAAMREADVKARARSEAAQPFDLSDGPLLRTTLLRLDASEHVLLLTMHHIISDGWSMGVLIGDLAAHYQAILSENTQPQHTLDEQILPLSVQYADYALWQRSWLRDEQLAELLNYWTQRFDPLPPVLELSTDRPRPPIQTYQGAIEPFQIDEPLLKALKELGHRQGATLYMTLLAAFMVLLHRWSGQSDLVVGSPIAGRTRRELEALIGFFVNTLALRADLSGNPAFTELLGRVRETTLGAYAHQELPFELLMDRLQPERDLSRQPLVQVMFVLQNTPLPMLQVDDLHLEPIPFDPGIAKFDLTLNLVEMPAGLDGSLEYNTDLFDGATIKRMAAQIQTILHSIVVQPEQPIAALPLLPAAEREQVLAWSSTPATYAAPECVHTLIAAQAARTPDATAAIYDSACLTYAELDCRSSQLAQYLQALGVGPEVCVSIYMEPSLEVMVGLLGVLKAGGAYVPLDLAYPQERLAYMLEDSGSRVVLTQQRLLATLPQHGATTVCLDRDWATIARHDPAHRASQVDPDQIAYVIYTSGSTGRPKGVMVSHRGLMSYLQWAVDVYQLDRGFGAPVHSSLGFDLTITSLFPPLLAGRCVTLLAPAAHIESLTAALNASPGFSLVKATPAHLDLLRHTLAAETLPAQTHSLVIGGEALRYERLAFWRSHAPATRLINEYGPTEAVVGCCIYEVAPDDPSTGLVPIGRPTAHTRLLILEPSGEPAPIGVPGEIFLGGAQLARGYLNRPDLTAEKFLPDPFSSEPGARLYRTGDLARFLPDGTIEFLGRSDDQVKLRGFRIELGEIEAVLREHQAIRDAVVLLRDERLVAYVVGEHRNTGTQEPGENGERRTENRAAELMVLGSAELRQWLGSRLPDHMIPSAFVFLESLPLTAHGKIDHRALPAPSMARPELDSAYVGPRTPTEQTLAAIWQELLGREQVGIHDNFFALGGDSIRSIAVVAAAQTAGLMLTVQQIFQHQTIAALAPLARAGRTEPQTQPAPFSLISAADRQRLPAAVEDAYPLTQLQLGMLFHSQYQPESSVYHSIHSYLLHGPCDAEVFAQAAQEVVDRHPVLRTAFELEQYQQPLQLVYKRVAVQVVATDLQALDEPEQDAALDAWMAQEREQAFNWREPGLVRFYLHRRAADRFQFSLSFHHAILDGWSVALLLTELFQRYMARLQGRPLTIDPLQTSVRSFVALERAAIESAEQQAFWAHALQDRPALALPLAAAPQPYAGPRQILIEPEVAEALKRLAAELGLPLRSVLLTAHLAVLRLISGQQRVITGLVTNGRPETPDGEQILGLFLNSVPFQIAIDRRSWRDLIRATFAAEQQMLPFRRYPLAQMQRDAGGQPLFEVLFNFVHFHAYQQIQQVPGLTALDQRSFGKTNFTLDVAFILGVDTKTIGLELDYDARLGVAQADRLVQLYLEMLRSIAAQPDRGYSAAALLSPAEYEQLRAVASAAESAHQYVHQMISAHAARTPEAIAVICDGASLSYAALDRRANQLARLLQRSGVGLETCVGVCLEPSLDLVVALLAVLKAGGTYLPLDPSYPANRLEFMLRDAQAQVVLTTAALHASVSSSSAALICLDRSGADVASLPQTPLSVTSSPEQLAYVIYTSGSTGQPKGVGVSHAAAAAHLQTFAETIGLSPADRLLQFAAPGFDVSIEQMLAPLAAGATVVLRGDQPWSLAELTQRIIANAVSVLNLPPAYWHQWLHDWLAQGNSQPPDHLRLMIVGGEALPLAAVQLWQTTSLANIRLLNAYGPTETTITATLAEVGAEWSKIDGVSALPIGRPLPGRAAYVLDDALDPVPGGVVGELHLGGDGLARGYLNRPGLTAEKFIPDPFSADPGSRLYRTGDLARSRRDGTIEFVGRIDQQVKLRGFRIELGEIEAALMQHEAVREAVVVVRDERLVAYVVKNHGESLEPGTENQARELNGSRFLALGSAELRQWLGSRLPDHMIPTAFVFLEALPRTISGKLDRRALPAPEQRREQTVVAPRDTIELRLVQLWEELLNVRPIGVHESFLELGGDSILALRLMAQIQQLFDQQLPLATLFQARTIDQLARRLRQQAAREPDAIVPIQPHGTRRPWFFVHPIGGNVLAYVELARQLGSDQPFYGLQSPGLGDPQRAHTSVETMAADYIAALRTIQPHGPYQLGGWSMGGVVAFEMARQLQACGEDLAALVLIDSEVPTPAAVIPSEIDLLYGFAHDLGLAVEPLATRTDGSAVQDDYFRAMLEQAQRSGVMPPDVGAPEMRRLFEVFKANLLALQRYEPQPYAGSIALFVAAGKHSPRTSDPRLAWINLVSGSVVVRKLPADHYTILKAPHVLLLAAEIQRGLPLDLDAAPVAVPASE